MNIFFKKIKLNINSNKSCYFLIFSVFLFVNCDKKEEDERIIKTLFVSSNDIMLSNSQPSMDITIKTNNLFDWDFKLTKGNALFVATKINDTLLTVNVKNNSSENYNGEIIISHNSDSELIETINIIKQEEKTTLLVNGESESFDIIIPGNITEFSLPVEIENGVEGLKWSAILQQTSNYELYTKDVEIKPGSETGGHVSTDLNLILPLYSKTMDANMFRKFSLIVSITKPSIQTVTINITQERDTKPLLTINEKAVDVEDIVSQNGAGFISTNIESNGEKWSCSHINLDYFPEIHGEDIDYEKTGTSSDSHKITTPVFSKYNANDRVVELIYTRHGADDVIVKLIQKRADFTLFVDGYNHDFNKTTATSSTEAYDFITIPVEIKGSNAIGTSWTCLMTQNSIIANHTDLATLNITSGTHTKEHIVLALPKFSKTGVSKRVVSLVFNVDESNQKIIATITQSHTSVSQLKVEQGIVQIPTHENYINIAISSTNNVNWNYVKTSGDDGDLVNKQDNNLTITSPVFYKGETKIFNYTLSRNGADDIKIMTYQNISPIKEEEGVLIKNNNDDYFWLADRNVGTKTETGGIHNIIDGWYATSMAQDKGGSPAGNVNWTGAFYTFDEAKNACDNFRDGSWETPTKEQFILINKSKSNKLVFENKTWKRYDDKEYGKFVYLPISGIELQGGFGYFWSKTKNNHNGVSLSIGYNGRSFINSTDKNSRLSVRCVKNL